jgi:hypothetical protein
MSYDPSIRVIKAGEQDELAWEVIPTEPQDLNPPGEEVVSFRAGDAMFSFGLWKRAPETGLDLPYHEITRSSRARSSHERDIPCTASAPVTRSSMPKGLEGDGRRSACQSSGHLQGAEPGR